MRNWFATPAILSAAIGAGSLLAGGARGELAPSILDSFESPTTVWRQPADPGATRVLAHVRSRDTRRGESIGVEHIRLACPAGYSGVFLYPIGLAPIVEDFKATIDLRSSAYGVRLAARVVLPAAADDSNQNGPVTMVVRGPALYQTPGQWATLRIEGLPALVNAQARLLRASPNSPAADTRQAYVDSLVLIVPSGPQGSEVWVDELRVEGPLVKQAIDDRLAGNSDGEAPDPATDADEPQPEVRASADGLAAAGELLFPLVWSSHGESVATVSNAGFNTLAVNQLPDEAMQAAAADRGMRLIAPLPNGGDAPAIDGVLAWRLPGRVAGDAIDSARPAIEAYRDDPILARRPLLVAPAGSNAAWSRLADGMLLDATRLGGVHESPFAATSSQCMPGAPAFAQVALTYEAQAADQLAAFAPSGKSPQWREVDAVQSDVWLAIGAGARGVWLQSDRPLGGALPSDQTMQAAIELLNLKAKLIKPWLAGGRRAAGIKDGLGKPLAAVFVRDRTRLIVGLATQAQPILRSFTVPSASETATAYRLTPAGLTPLKQQRVLGGVSIKSPPPGPGQFILLTDDRVAVRDIQRRVARIAARTLTLQQRLVIAGLKQFETMMGEAGESFYTKPVSGVAAACKRAISQSQAAEASSDLTGAYLAASRGLLVLSRGRREVFGRLTPAVRLDSSPLTHSPATWPDEIRLRQLLRALPRKGNRLAGGDFEDLATLKQLGWSYTRADNRRASVKLVDTDPKHGERALWITCDAAGGNAGEASAWVTSPTVKAEAGQLLEVTGWVRFEPASAGPGALVVVDSLGGETLSLTLREAADWRPFRLLRRPTSSEGLKLSFVLYGAGRGEVDAVMVRPVQLSAPTLRAADRRTHPK
ncbi:MAG: hypothetical protein AAGJ46_04045 [Planctomycetota bacterium]